MAQFIVVEGGEFVGKTTLIHNLVAELTNAGIRSLTLPVPSRESPVGRIIREQVISSDGLVDKTTPEVRGLLFLASIREQAEYIASVQKDYDVIICDRWFYTTLAYNDPNYTAGDSVLTGAIETLFVGIDSRDIEFTNPNLVIYLRGAAEAYQRAQASPRYKDALDTVGISSYIEREEIYDEVFRDRVFEPQYFLMLDIADTSGHLPEVLATLSMMGIVPKEPIQPSQPASIEPPSDHAVLVNDIVAQLKANLEYQAAESSAYFKQIDAGEIRYDGNIDLTLLAEVAIAEMKERGVLNNEGDPDAA